jgi:hypothetical protein
MPQKHERSMPLRKRQRQKSEIERSNILKKYVTISEKT